MNHDLSDLLYFLWGQQLAKKHVTALSFKQQTQVINNSAKTPLRHRPTSQPQPVGIAMALCSEYDVARTSSPLTSSGGDVRVIFFRDLVLRTTQMADASIKRRVMKTRRQIMTYTAIPEVKNVLVVSGYCVNIRCEKS